MSKNPQLEEIKNIIKNLELMDNREVNRCYKEVNEILKSDEIDLPSYEERKIKEFMENLYELEKLLKEMESERKSIIY